MSNTPNDAGDAQLVKQALVALRQARQKLDAIEQSHKDPIAIIGMACRFPGGANSPDEFWQLLENGTDAISRVPDNRWDVDEMFDADPSAPGKLNSRWGGFIDSVDQFDAGFFGISPREATQMDPQQRLMLEVAWEALENAGLTKKDLAGSRTGVYIGIHSHSADYTLRQYADLNAVDIYTGTGTAHNVIAGRIAYLFDLRGPSLTVDTACSSSLVAIHLACQSLRDHESEIALVGGVNLILSPEFTIAASKMHMLAPDGRCKTFDAAANGFVRGEGCALIVLKRLSDALANGDNILALIRGSAINQDGRTNGLTAPNGLAQQQVIRQALENAGIQPSQVGYIEAHGTGTSLGDVIELDALGAIFERTARDGNPCFLGSAKSNIGHLEGAAGIAGVIKAVLSLQKKKIPAIMHFKNLNPNISIEHTAFVIPTAPMVWDEGTERIAGVSSFGWSGTNAHAILSEAPRMEAGQANTDLGNFLLPLSADSPKALQNVAKSYLNFLNQKNDSSLFDICYTASCRRTHHPERIAFVGPTTASLTDQISAYLQGGLLSEVEVGKVNDQSKVVFVFPGQGSQWLGMGRELIRQNQVFRETLEQCESALRPWVEWSLIEQLTLDEDSPKHRLSEISVIQPVLFALAIAFSALWQSWGIEPHAVIGHSMGEVAAAYVSGALSLEDAAHIICTRSQLMQKTSGRGAMAVVGLNIPEVTKFLKGFEDKVSIAVSNSSHSTVVSGDPQVLEKVMDALAKSEIFCRYVKVDVASHSPQMDPLRPALVESLQGIQPQATQIPFFSTVTEEISDGTTLNAEYWGKNLRQPVQFGSMVQKLMETDHAIFIEMSPHPILLTSIQEIAGELNKPGHRFASLRRAQPELASMLTELGSLYRLGYPVDWKKLYPSGRRVVSLPAYPWQHERFWLDVDTGSRGFAQTRFATKESEHPVLGQEVELAVQHGNRTWEFDLSIRRFPYLYDHELQENAILAASHYLEMALAAAKVEFGGQPILLRDVEFQRPLFLPTDRSTTRMQLHLTAEKDNSVFQIFSHAAKSWTKHSVGRVSTFQGHGQPISLVEIKSRLTNEMEGDTFYTKLENNKVGIGKNAQILTRLWHRPGESLGILELKDKSVLSHQLELVILDGCFQLSAAALGLLTNDDPNGDVYVASKLDQVQIYREFDARMWVHVQTRENAKNNSESFIEDIHVYTESGQLAAEMLGIHLQKLESQNLYAVPQDIADWLYQIQWEVSPRNPIITSVSSEAGFWLILADQKKVGATLADRLREQGEQCILVFSGETFESQEDYFVIRPENAQDMQQLLESVFDSDAPSCRGIIDLWSLDAPAISDLDASSLETAQISSCSSLLYLVQELSKLEWKERPRLWVVTQGAQPILDVHNDSVSPIQAMLWGLGRVVAREHAEFWGGLIDLDPAADFDRLVPLLQAEVTMPDQESEMAFRNSERYVARLAPLPHSISSTVSFHLRADSTYLVSGGLGDVGVQVAHWMVKKGARRLILMGRTPLPPRAQWNQVDPASAVGRKIAAVESLEASGASIHLAAVDLADEYQLIKFIEIFQSENWPPIRGVFHAAAVIEDRLLVNLDTDALRTVLRPKAVGAWLLHRLFKDVDYFVLFSSVGALLGQAGQSNYAAANAFLDALACYRHGTGMVGVSINWGAWRGLGFAASSGGQQTITHLEAQGMSSFSAEDGLKAMNLILEGKHAQVTVIPANWTAFRQAHKDDPIPVSPLLSSLLAAQELGSISKKRSNEDGIRERLLNAVPEEQAELLKKYIQEQVARALRMPQVNILADQALGALGLESLMAIELRNRFEADLKIKLSATLIWNYPTINQLTTHLAGKLNILQDANLPAQVKETRLESKPGKTGKTVADVNTLSEEEIMQTLLLRKGNRNG
jgi:myxalamid-type polyketide synthase MxaD